MCGDLNCAFDFRQVSHARKLVHLGLQVLLLLLDLLVQDFDGRLLVTEAAHLSQVLVDDVDRAGDGVDLVLAGFDFVWNVVQTR